MAKSYYKQSSSVLTKCFRSNKTISTPILISNSDITANTCPSNTCSLSSIIEAIQTIDQLVRSADDCNKQQGDSHCIQKTMNIERIEEMLIKWTHIAHFLVDTYQQIQTTNNQSQKKKRLD